MIRSKLRIGITIGLQVSGETLWNNGIKQNAAFLAMALKNCPNVGVVALLNTTSISLENMAWDTNLWPTFEFESVKDHLDIVIELGGQISAEQTGYLKERGVRLVSYCCTTEYIMAMESVVYGRKLWGTGLFINQRYDDIWLIPQVAALSGGYFSLLRRQQTRVVPFVWDPVFIELNATTFPNQGTYVPRSGPRRLGVLEPNHDVVKFCLYPALIAEEAYRRRPDLIGQLRVTNAERMARNNPSFIALMNYLDVVRDGKTIFLPRYETPSFLTEHCDLVVSHQLENALNYLYLEVCWQGFPLIHNAHLCSDLGYYYQGNDSVAGADQVLNAIQHHDASYVLWRNNQRSMIQRYLPTSLPLVAHYSDLLYALMNRPLR